MKSTRSFWWKCIRLAHSDSVAFANDWQWLFGVPIGTALIAWWANRQGHSEISTGKPIVDGILVGAGTFVITYLVVFIPRLLRAPAQFYGEQKELADFRLGTNTDKLKSAVQRLFRFPAATLEIAEPETLLESIIDDQPRRLFEIIAQFEERDVMALPNYGQRLQDYFELYHDFRQHIVQFEIALLPKIINGHDWFPAAWQILKKYALYRFCGMTKEQIMALGNFLNYGITWDRAENDYQRVSSDTQLSEQSAEIDSIHDRVCGALSGLKASFEENS